MTQRSPAKASVLAVWLPRLASSVAFVIALGFLFHTSLEPVVFGKYDASYAAFLAVVFLFIQPAFHYLARFCAAEHELKSRSGRTFVVRPRHKLAALLIAACAIYPPASAIS